MNHALQVKKEDLVIGSRLSGDQDLNFDELEVRGACTPAALHLLLRERLPGVAPPPSRTFRARSGLLSHLGPRAGAAVPACTAANSCACECVAGASGKVQPAM